MGYGLFVEAARIQIKFEEEHVRDLQRRLANGRPLHDEVSRDWSEGTSVDELVQVLEQWGTNYSVASFLERLNRHPHYTMDNGFGGQLHYIHIPSMKPHAVPLLLLHGWPGGVLEFLDAAPNLEMYHLVIPSLPGFGLSSYIPIPQGKLALSIMAEPMKALMTHLNYSQYFAQGGDLGAYMATEVCNTDPACLAYHLNFASHGPPWAKGLGGVFQVIWTWFFPAHSFPDPEERRIALDSIFPLKMLWNNFGYLHMHATKPQTLALALSASPVALASWLLEKFHGWDGGLPVEKKIDMLTWYWLTNRGGSLRVYRDLMSSDRLPLFLDFLSQTRNAPVGYSNCRDLTRSPLKWFRYYHSEAVYYNRVEEAGHFFAWQNPFLFAREFGNFLHAFRV